MDDDIHVRAEDQYAVRRPYGNSTPSAIEGAASLLAQTRTGETEGSITFVWEMPDDETAVFSVEFGPSTPTGEPVLEEMGRATYDQHGTAGITLLKDTLEKCAEAIGAGWSER